MKRLTFDGINDLYQTPYGAYTLKQYEEILELRKKIKPLESKERKEVFCSLEMEIRNERCIEQFGCSSF